MCIVVLIGQNRFNIGKCNVANDNVSTFKDEVLKDNVNNQLISANFDTVVIIYIK